MPKRPRLPGPALLAWLTINAHVIALGALFGLYHSATFKLVIGGLDLFGFSAMLIFYLGRLREWDRLVPHLNSLDRQQGHSKVEPALGALSSGEHGGRARRVA